MELKWASFEQAKALAELGFPQSEYGPHYKENGEPENGLTDLGEGIYFVPTLELVAKWLREEKSCYISPIPACYELQHEFFSAWRITIQWEDNFDEYEEWLETYEDALSSGIDKVIEILKDNE